MGLYAQSCISEAQKYQKSVYRPDKKKGKEKGKGKEKEKEKAMDTDKTMTDTGDQGNQNESGGTQSVALGPDEGDTPQTDKQKEAEEEEKDKLVKEDEAGSHEAKDEGKTVDNGGDKKEASRAVKSTKEKGDKKRKWKSSEVVVSEEDEGPADKLKKKKKKGEEQEGEGVKKQPKDKKSKNKEPKMSEEKPSVLPAVVPSPEISHQPDNASIPSTAVNEKNNAPPPPTATPTPAPSGAGLPPSQALSSDHFLSSIPTGKEILMVRLIKKLKKTGSENEVWELLKRAKVAKDSDGKVVLTLK